MSITVCITSLIDVNSTVLYDEKTIDATIIYDDSDTTIVKLSSPITAHFIVNGVIKQYEVVYVRLINATGSIIAYIPNSYSDMNVQILESILSSDPSIAYAYRPISGHTFTIM